MAVNSYVQYAEGSPVDFVIEPAHEGEQERHVCILPKSVGMQYLREGRKISYRGNATMLLVKLGVYETPFAENDMVSQETIDGKTYVVNPVQGYIRTMELDNHDMWEWLGDDEGVMIVPHEEAPHTGHVCEYSGEDIDEPWFSVMWTDCDHPTHVQGAGEALTAWLTEVEDVDTQENGWSLHYANVVTRRHDEDGYVVTCTNVKGHHDYVEAEQWDEDRQGDMIGIAVEDAYEGASAMDVLTERLAGSRDFNTLMAFAVFLREEGMGQFIVSVDSYEG